MQQFAVEIKKQLHMGKKQKELRVPGNTPYRKYEGVPFKPQPDKKCDHCGQCAGKCPVQAISKENLMKADTKKVHFLYEMCCNLPKESTQKKVLLFAASQKMKKACEGRKKNELFLQKQQEN